MIILLLTFFFSVNAETTKSDAAEATTADSGASADLQAIADRYTNYNKCADKVWPKPLIGKRSMAFVDHDGTAWRWSAEKGLTKITNTAEAKEVVALVGTRGYVVNRNANPPEVILSVGAKKPGGSAGGTSGAGGSQTAPPTGGTPGGAGQAPAGGSQASGGSQTSKNPACDKAMEDRKNLIKGLYKTPDLSTVDSVFKLGVHENFHVCDQSSKESWPHDLISHTETMNRINDYPPNAEPRQMRYKLKSAMREALKETNPDARQKYLQEAAYWHKEYKKKYGDKESFKSTDIFEGTARYVDLVANKIDCSKPLDSNKLAAISREAILEGIAEDPEPTVDTESYALGALSGALLDQQRSLDWKTKTATKGKSPLDQLLDSVTPKKGTLSNESKLDAIAGIAPKLADECYVKPDFDYLSKYKDGKHVWVSVPTTRYNGKGSYDGKSVLPSKYVNIGSAAQTKNMKTSNLPHVVASSNPCGGEESMMVLVDINSVQNGNVNFEIPGEPPSKAQGTVDTQPKSSPLGNVYCSPP